jgi:hypothetical protein
MTAKMTAFQDWQQAQALAVAAEPATDEADARQLVERAQELWAAYKAIPWAAV